MGFFSRLFGLSKKEDKETSKSNEQLEQLSNVQQDQQSTNTSDDTPIASEIDSHEQSMMSSTKDDNEAVFTEESDLKEADLHNDVVDNIATQVEEAEKKEPSCDSNKQEVIAKPQASEDLSSPTDASALEQVKEEEVVTLDVEQQPNNKLDLENSSDEDGKQPSEDNDLQAEVIVTSEQVVDSQDNIELETQNKEEIVSGDDHTQEQEQITVQLDETKSEEATEQEQSLEIVQAQEQDIELTDKEEADKEELTQEESTKEDSAQAKDEVSPSDVDQQSDEHLEQTEDESKVEAQKSEVQEPEVQEEKKESKGFFSFLFGSSDNKSKKSDPEPEQINQEKQELEPSIVSEDKEEPNDLAEQEQKSEPEAQEQEDLIEADTQEQFDNTKDKVQEQAQESEAEQEVQEQAQENETEQEVQEQVDSAKDNVQEQAQESEIEQESSQQIDTVENKEQEQTDSLEQESQETAEQQAESSTALVLQEKVVAEAKAEKESFFARLKRTRDNLALGVSSLIKGRKIDDDLYESLEDALITSDLGVETTQYIIERLQNESRLRDLHDAGALRKNLKHILCEILEPCQQPLDVTKHSPFVILMVGVNGAGKTTTIGKLARKFQDQGLSVMLAAGDTFRAAAVEQLKEWGNRSNVPVIAQATGSDSASVLFDALNAAKARKIDVLLCDTAGRLQNKDNLMEELKKIVRVLKKIDENVPHETLLVLDAATGQNAISQTKIFTSAVNVSGLVLTKLDGTAKGGVVFNLAKQFNIPIRYVGIGEKVEDLREFKIEPFVDALVEDSK